MQVLDPISSTIRATNPTDETVTVGGIVFAPGASKYVTFLWMRNHYGDPRSIPDAPRIVKLPGSDQAMAVQPRQTELARVNTVWGMPHREGGWDSIPKLQFFTEDNERLVTPFEDPSGMSTSLHTESEATFAAQQDRIDKLEKTLDMVLKATGVSKENLPFDVDNPITEDIPTDDSVTDKTTSPWNAAEAIFIDDDDAVNG